MAINPDFRDLFAALNDAGARYLLVGGYALAVHTVPRFTKGLDVWVDATPANAPLVINALRMFGAAMESLGEADLSRPGIVFQIGLAPNRIDILTDIDGVTAGASPGDDVRGVRGSSPSGEACAGCRSPRCLTWPYGHGYIVS